MIFNTKVNHIPCLCKVILYVPSLPAILKGPDNSYPAEPAEFEFELLDLNERRAQWLDKYLTPAVEERLLEEYQLTVDAERFGY